MNLTQSLFPPSWRPELFGTLVQDINPNLFPGADNSVPAALLNYAATGSAGNYGTIIGTPKLKRNILNGQSGVLFDGVGDEAITTFNTPAGARTDFFVFKTVTNPTLGNTAVVNLDKTATPDHFKVLFLRNAVAGGYQPYDIGAKAVNDVVAGVGIADALDTNAHILAITYNNGNRNDVASYTISLDGVAKTVVASGANTVPTTYLSTIGAIDIGGGPLAAWNGYFFRKLVFSGLMAAPQRAVVEQDLHLLFGI